MASPNPLEGAQEIQQMVVSYAKQETVEPLKHLGRYLGFGVAGSVMVFMGTFFWALAVLRLMQSFEVFSGSSWGSMAPYLLAILTLALILILIYSAMSRARRKVR
ncbi:MAG: phage holin family protein [Actinomycetota bacterium]